MCSPTASVTCLPERWISSASCTPVAEAPTMSTPPGSSCSGFRYSIGVSDNADRGIAALTAGTSGMLCAPLAMTTARQIHVPRSVTTT